MVYLIVDGARGKPALEALLAAGCEVEVLDAGPAAGDREVLGRKAAREEKVLPALERAAGFCAVVPDGASRRRIVERWEAGGHRLVRVLHPRSWLSHTASLGPGVVALALSVVQSEVQVGKGALIDATAALLSDCRIGEYAHLGAGARVCEGAVVGAGAWVGVGSVVLEGVAIGARAVVGAGSVVADDLPPDVVAHGNPCRVVRRIGRGE